MIGEYDGNIVLFHFSEAKNVYIFVERNNGDYDSTINTLKRWLSTKDGEQLVMAVYKEEPRDFDDLIYMVQKLSIEDKDSVIVGATP